MSIGRMARGIAAWGALAALAAPAPAPEAAFNVDIPAGEWKSARLKNLPQGASVSVEVRTSAPIDLALLGEEDYRSYPSPARPLFRGRAEAKLTFAVTIPATGHYYVVLDNRSGREARSVELGVTAERGSPEAAGAAGGAGSAPGSASKGGGDATGPPGAADPTDAKLREFQAGLNQVFVFRAFPIRVETCGAPRAFSGPTGIVLCREYALKLYEHLGDKGKAADALMFTLFHELGHELLRQWSSPVYDNEEVADEFAAAVMVMLGEKERVRSEADFLASNSVVAESIVKALSDDRHPLSAQRSRNILRWLGDPGFVRKWQPLLVPHMQTALLEKIRSSAPAWSDAALVESELAVRGAASPP